VKSSGNEIVESLYILSQFNTAEQYSGKDLRKFFAATRMEAFKKMLSNFEGPQKAFQELEREIQILGNTCDEIKTHLNEVLSTRLVSQSLSISNEIKDYEIKRNIVEDLLNKLVLTGDDLKEFEVVDDNFFKSFERLSKIKFECENLDYKAGNEVLEYICNIEDMAFETLRIWCRHIITEMGNDAPKITPTMQKVVGIIRSKRQLFESLFGEIFFTRRNVIRNCFIDIDISTDDEVKKCKEIFAHVHQKAASEKETLEWLLLDEEDNQFIISDTIVSMLDNILESICRPLKNRIDEIFYKHSSSILSMYKIANTIQFYTSTMQRMMPKEEEQLHFLRDLEKLTQLAFRNFYDAVGRFVRELYADFTPIEEEQPPPIFFHFVKVLNELLHVYEKNMCYCFLQVKKHSIFY